MDGMDTQDPRSHKQKIVREAWSPVPDWNSRGYLPHCNETGFTQLITFRLYDSVPAKVIEQWQKELKTTPGLTNCDSRKIELLRRVEKYEDAGHGECLLGHPEIAEIVKKNMLFFDGERYRLLEWCIMPNHVHVLIQPVNGWLLADIVHSWKSFTGHAAKEIFNLTRPFWKREYHDRFIRDEKHFENARNYIRQNPVTARLVRNAEDWPWSSAQFSLHAGEPPAGPVYLE
ncbi:MAG: transposase [Acidobacteria bacterium]|nr:transposase [Acidobacteriota bacterium]